MLLSIEHVTDLSYTGRVSESVMEARVTPRTDEHQTLRGSRIEIGPHAPLLEYDDWLGNRVHQFSVIPFHDRVQVIATAGVATHRVAVDLAAAPDPIGSQAARPRGRWPRGCGTACATRRGSPPAARR